MKITSITYQRVRNLGQYESLRYEETWTIEPGDSIADERKEIAAAVEQTSYQMTLNAQHRKRQPNPDDEPLPF